MTKLYVVKNDTFFEDVTEVSNFFGDTRSFVFFRNEDVIGEHEFYGEMEYTHDDGTTEWMNVAPSDDFVFFTPEQYKKIQAEDFQSYFKEQGLEFSSMSGNGDFLFFETYDADDVYQAVTYEDRKLSLSKFQKRYPDLDAMLKRMGVDYKVMAIPSEKEILEDCRMRDEWKERLQKNTNLRVFGYDLGVRVNGKEPWFRIFGLETKNTPGVVVQSSMNGQFYRKADLVKQIVKELLPKWKIWRQKSWRQEVANMRRAASETKETVDRTKLQIATESEENMAKFQERYQDLDKMMKRLGVDYKATTVRSGKEIVGELRDDWKQRLQKNNNLQVFAYDVAANDKSFRIFGLEAKNSPGIVVQSALDGETYKKADLVKAVVEGKLGLEMPKAPVAKPKEAGDLSLADVTELETEEPAVEK